MSGYSNQTNLAIKGIIGIEAMSQVSTRIGNTAMAANYTSIAKNYLAFWQQHGIASSATPPHTNLAYDNNTTYGMALAQTKLVIKQVAN